MKRTTAILLAITLLLMSLTSCRWTTKKLPRREETTSAVIESVTDAGPDMRGLVETHECVGFDDQTAAKLADISRTYHPVAVQFALLNGNTIKTFCYGYADAASGRAVNEDTKYRIASLTKLVTAVVFMAAKDRGIVDEGEDISDYFRETCRNPSYPDTVITPAMLMTHTSSLDIEGYSEYYSGMLNDRGTYLRFKPGTSYEYSNLGYGVLSCALERASGIAFNEMARSWLFTPMKIDASYIYNELTDASDVGVLYGENGGLSIAELREITRGEIGMELTMACGNLIISAKDYAKLLGMLLHDGIDVDGTRILSQGSAAAMLEERFRTQSFGVAYGSQIQTNVIEGKTVYVHTGSSYGMFSAYVFDPETKQAAVAFTVGEDRYLDSDSEVYYLCQDLIRAVW